MESKLVLHTKTRHINVYAHPENVTHLTKEKMGTLNLQGGTVAYVKQFIDDHNQDESAHPYIQGNLSTLEGTVTEHIEDTNNPHAVTKEQVGLGNVDNTADLDKPISTATQAALNGKQATISDLETIRSGAALGATAVQPGDLATVATTGDYDDLTNKPTIPSQASDVHALPDTTKYGASLDLDINSSTYVVTAQLKDQDGNTLGTAQTIDLPLESVVVNGSYDSANKKVVLTLQNGSTIEFSVADLVAGLQSEITSSNKLSADLVDDTNTTHKFVTTSEKSTWNGKQDAISDLATIRSGAAAGATALQPSVAASTYATKAEIADQYTESNLVPKVPVAFTNAQVSDFYTVVGSPTISADGVASGFSNSDYLEVVDTFNIQDNFHFHIDISNFTNTGRSQFIFGVRGTNSFGAYLGSTAKGISAVFGNTYWTNVSPTLTVGNPFTIDFSGDGTTLKFTINQGNSTKTSTKTIADSGMTGSYSLKIGINASTQAFTSGSINLNNTYIKVNGKYFVPPLSSTIVSVSSMTGATSSAAGASGLVPAPAAGDEAKFLRGDGTWVGSTSAAAWGSLTGTLSDQTDLQNALNAKQATISDLATIRSGASAGATAVQPAALQTAINSVKRNIGEIVPSTIPLTDAGLHLLDGSVISGSGSYSAFVTYIAGLVSDYPDLFETEANWQTSVTNYGVCGKFVYDSVNNTVRLPLFASEKRFLIDSYKDGDTWYRIYSDGWCEQGGKITGIGSNTSYSGTFSKAFIDTHYSLNFSLQSSTGTQTNDEYGFIWVQSTDGFTAYQSNSGTWNSIWVASGYTNISTYKVTQLYEYIVVANTAKTPIEVDIDEIATDLNAKVDKADLSEVQCVVETYSNGTSWYRVYSDGWCEQGGRFAGPVNNSSSFTVSFLKDMADTSYTVSFCGTTASTVLTATARYKNSLQFFYSNNKNNVSGSDFSWEIKGYIDTTAE